MITAEKDWQRTVANLAGILGFSVYHTYDSRRSTAGFPDLVLVRERIIYAELKSDVGKLSDAQVRWRDDLIDAGGEFYVWRPVDWPEVQRVLKQRMPRFA